MWNLGVIETGQWHHHLVNSFHTSVSSHGLCYIRIIGDMDRLVMANLQQTVV